MRRLPAVPLLSRLLPAGLVLLVAAGCASLPTQGPVERAGVESPSSSAAPFDFNPPGPEPGSTPAQIVSGYLRALQATPVTTRVAAEFLGPESTLGWRPDRRTIVYGSERVRQHGHRVQVKLGNVFELDGHGRWDPRRPGPHDKGSTALDFHLVRDAGEWRIVDPPDAMIVPRSHFETRYREYSLYFFDPGGHVLVPEPVYLPAGVQAPTLLVSALLEGPQSGNRAVERTYFPRGTKLEVSVPVRRNGVADVPLTAPFLELGDDARQLAVAQLAWTLRQVPDIQAVQITVDGTPVEVPGNRGAVDVGAWQEYSPAIASASTDLFGVRGDAVVQVVGDKPLSAADLGGYADQPPRSLGVNMTGQHMAVVRADGRQVVVLSRASSDVRPRTAYVGSDVLRPMWDRTDRLWLVDRTPEGTRVLVGSRAGVRPIAAPGLGAQDVLAAALSRDGSRLAVAVAGRHPGSVSGARLLVLRVVRKNAGAPLRLTRPQPLTTGAPLVRVRGLSWRDPSMVAVLTRPSRTTSEVLLAACDGSTSAVGLDAAVDVLFARGTTMAASPGGPTALVVVTADGQLHQLDVGGRWVVGGGPTGLRIPAYVG
jgi:hypothetical protein